MKKTILVVALICLVGVSSVSAQQSTDISLQNDNPIIEEIVHHVAFDLVFRGPISDIPLSVSGVQAPDKSVSPGEQVTITVDSQLGGDARTEHIWMFREGENVEWSKDWRGFPTITLNNDVILKSKFDDDDGDNRNRLSSNFNVCDSFTDKSGYYVRTQTWCNKLIQEKSYTVDFENDRSIDSVTPDPRTLEFIIDVPQEEGTYKYSFVSMEYIFPTNEWYKNPSTQGITLEVASKTPTPTPTVESTETAIPTPTTTPEDGKSNVLEVIIDTIDNFLRSIGIR